MGLISLRYFRPGAGFGFSSGLWRQKDQGAYRKSLLVVRMYARTCICRSNAAITCGFSLHGRHSVILGPRGLLLWYVLPEMPKHFWFMFVVLGRTLSGSAILVKWWLVQQCYFEIRWKIVP